jgi:hypothetical protein
MSTTTLRPTEPTDEDAGSSTRTSEATRLPLVYHFSIECPLASTTPPPIDVPGGTRVQVSYLSDRSRVFTRDNLFRASWNDQAPRPDLGRVTEADRTRVEELAKDRDRKGLREYLAKLTAEGRAEMVRQQRPWPGIEGSIQSGSDAVFVREDGVAVFDGRFTIKDARGFLIGVVAAGVADLRDGLPAGMSGPAAYAAYVNDARSKTDGQGFPSQGIPVRLALRFEVSTDPGRATDFAAPRYITQTLEHWKYERLARSQFLGLGTLQVQESDHWPFKHLSLDVFDLGAHQATVGEPWKN